MGYELWEEFGGELPDVIVYPTGGGVGLIGMWKAFEELETMGLTGSHRPRMIAAQADGCAPIVRAFERRAEASERWENAATLAAGLRVPKALGDFLILADIYASRGEAVAVSEARLLAACRDMARLEGVFAAPEGGVGLAAIDALVTQGKIGRDESVVLFNTGSGYKYLEAWQAALPSDVTRRWRTIHALGGPAVFRCSRSASLRHAVSGSCSIGLLVWMAWWWMAEPVHFAITAFLPVIVPALAAFARVETIERWRRRAARLPAARRQHACNALATVGPRPADCTRVVVDGHRHQHSTADCDLVRGGRDPEFGPSQCRRGGVDDAGGRGDGPVHRYRGRAQERVCVCAPHRGGVGDECRRIGNASRRRITCWQCSSLNENS